MEPERLKLACEGKTRSQGGLNVKELEALTGLNGVGRDKLVAEVCRMVKSSTDRKGKQPSSQVQYYSLVKSSNFRNGVASTQFQQETEVRGSKGHRKITKDGKTTTHQLSEKEIVKLTQAPMYLPLLYI